MRTINITHVDFRTDALTDAVHLENTVVDPARIVVQHFPRLFAQRLLHLILRELEHVAHTTERRRLRIAVLGLFLDRLGLRLTFARGSRSEMPARESLGELRQLLLDLVATLPTDARQLLDIDVLQEGLEAFAGCVRPVANLKARARLGAIRSEPGEELVVRDAYRGRAPSGLPDLGSDSLRLLQQLSGSPRSLDRAESDICFVDGDGFQLLRVGEQDLVELG